MCAHNAHKNTNHRLATVINNCRKKPSSHRPIVLVYFQRPPIHIPPPTHHIRYPVFPIFAMQIELPATHRMKSPNCGLRTTASCAYGFRVRIRVPIAPCLVYCNKRNLYHELLLRRTGRTNVRTQLSKTQSRTQVQRDLGHRNTLQIAQNNIKLDS